MRVGTRATERNGSCEQKGTNFKARPNLIHFIRHPTSHTKFNEEFDERRLIRPFLPTYNFNASVKIYFVFFEEEEH